MSQTEITNLPSGEALAFLGIAAQALAIVWIWRDWQMSQYLHSHWKKKHNQTESQTLKSLDSLWAKFGGPATSTSIDWDSIGGAELDDIAKEFPTNGDDDALKQRKISALTPRYGIGPSDIDLFNISAQLKQLAILRRGVADYSTFIRKKTFQTALILMLIGFALQLLGAWPSRWLIQIETPAPATQTLPK
jgi:hypothetical protein